MDKSEKKVSGATIISCGKGMRAANRCVNGWRCTNCTKVKGSIK